MGIIRGGLVALTSILLFLSLLSMNTFMTMSLSLRYDTIKPNLDALVFDVAKENVDINQFDNLIKLYCQNLKNESIPVGDFINTTFTAEENISCITALQEGGEAVLKDLISKGINKSYYAEYNCTLFNCNFNEGNQVFSMQRFLFLFSKQMQDYWRGKFYLALTAVIIFSSLLLLLIENKSSFPFLAGGLVIIASLPFLGMNWLIRRLTTEYIQFILLYFSKSFFTFMLGAVIGVVLIVLGIAVKFLNLGDKVFGFFRKS